jgi:hypothetical protein
VAAILYQTLAWQIMAGNQTGLSHTFCGCHTFMASHTLAWQNVARNQTPPRSHKLWQKLANSMTSGPYGMIKCGKNKTHWPDKLWLGTKHPPLGLILCDEVISSLF